MLFRCAGVCRGDRGGGFRSGSGSRLMDSGSLDAFPRVKVSCTGLGCGYRGQRYPMAGSEGCLWSLLGGQLMPDGVMRAPKPAGSRSGAPIGLIGERGACAGVV